MITIHKYELIPGGNGVCEVGTTQGAVFLSVGTQTRYKQDTRDQVEGIFVWMLLDDQRPTEVRTFHVFGTGHEVPMKIAAMPFVGTVHFKTAQYVFHVFMEPAQ